MPSRLLTLMRKRGGFNPLSLNPTLWALPANSFSRTGGQFTAASSQYLSVASNSTLQVGVGVPFWVSLWCNPTTIITGNYQMLVAKLGEYDIRINPGGGFEFTNTTAGTSATAIISAGAWQHFFCYSDGAGTFGIIKNSGSPSTASNTSPIVSTHAFQIGARNGAYFYGGLLDNILFGKAPTESFVNIATALFKSNNGLPFQSITAQQQSDWGIVSGWLDNSLTADAFGSNTLTNVNGVTQAAGKVSAIAVNNDPTYFVNDASTNDNDLTQVTLAARPLYKSAGYWTFDGTGDRLTVAESMGGLSAATIVVVAKINDVPATHAIVNCNVNILAIFQANTNRQFFVGSDVYGSHTSTNRDWVILVMRYDGSGSTNAERLIAYENGGTQKTLSFIGTIPATLEAGSNEICIGGLNHAPVYHTGDISEVLIAPSALTDAQLNAYGNYLVSKYPSLSLSWTDIT